jgi:hypothetical protein
VTLIRLLHKFFQSLKNTSESYPDFDRDVSWKLWNSGRYSDEAD